MIVTILLCVIVGLIVGYCSFWIGYHKGYDDSMETVEKIFEAKLKESNNDKAD